MYIYIYTTDSGGLWSMWSFNDFHIFHPKSHRDAMAALRPNIGRRNERIEKFHSVATSH